MIKMVFSIVLRAILTEHDEGKQHIKVQNNNASWKTQSSCGSGNR